MQRCDRKQVDDPEDSKTNRDHRLGYERIVYKTEVDRGEANDEARQLIDSVHVPFDVHGSPERFQHYLIGGNRREFRRFKQLDGTPPPRTLESWLHSEPDLVIGAVAGRATASGAAVGRHRGDVVFHPLGLVSNCQIDDFIRPEVDAHGEVEIAEVRAGTAI